MTNISIIMAVYNREKYLAEAIDSVMMQDLNSIELIIVDDGSTDSSADIINEYKKKYSNIRSHTHKNSGVAFTKNTGISLAKGKYIIFLDSDDIMIEGALSSMFKLAERHKADMVVGITRFFNEVKSWNDASNVSLCSNRFIEPHHPNLINTYSMSNKLFLRNHIIKNNIKIPQDLSLSEDGVFVMRFAFSSKCIVGCPKEIFQYRKPFFDEHNSLTRTFSVDVASDLNKATQIIYAEATRYFQKLMNKYKNKKLEFSMILEDYLHHLYIKDASKLLGFYYRKYWLLTPEFFDFVRNNIMNIKNILTPAEWKHFMLNNSDVDFDCLEKGYFETYLFSIVFCFENESKQTIINAITRIYNQSLVDFELLVNDKVYSILQDSDMSFANIRKISGNSTTEFENNCVKDAKGSYIIFTDSQHHFIIDSLTGAYRKIKSTDHNFATLSLIQYVDGERRFYPSQMLALNHLNSSTDFETNPYHVFDLIRTNKVFKVDYLQSIGFAFTENHVADILNLYKEAKFIKLNTQYIVCDLSDEQILSNIKHSGCLDQEQLLQFDNMETNLAVYMGERAKRMDKKQSDKVELEAELYENAMSLEMEITKIKSVLGKVFRLLPMRKQIFFLSIRTNNHFEENMQTVFDKVNAKKVRFCKKYPHRNLWQIKILYLMATSKMVVTDDYIRAFREYIFKDTQRVVQLWHACGAYKKFGMDSGGLPRATEYMTHCQYSAVMVSSEGVRDIYANAMGISNEKVMALGVPRTDVFFSEKAKSKAIKKFNSLYPTLKEKKIILYAPTFREFESKKSKFSLKINWKLISDELGEDQVLVIKKHPVVKGRIIPAGKYPNIIQIDDISTNELMFVTSVLVTDYSSVFFEFSLLRKPMVFFCPDILKYDRDFYINFPDELPGPLTTNVDELLTEIKKAIESPDLSKVDQMVSKYMEACDGKSTDRVAKWMEDQLN